jgi:DNA-binding NtrC family response regulator
MFLKKKIYPLIFIVEDNKAYNKIVEHHLHINGFKNVVPFMSGEECLKNISLKPDIVIQDYKLQGISGINVLQRFKKTLPGCEFIFLSSQDNVEIAINTIKTGAFDYIVKNETSLQRLLQKIENIIKIQKLKKRNKRYIKAFYLVALFLIITLAFLYFSTDIFFF